jgi:hypothetical protein
VVATESLVAIQTQGDNRLIKVDCLLSAYSVEKLQIRGGAILLRRERTRVDPGMTCI